MKEYKKEVICKVFYIVNSLSMLSREGERRGRKRRRERRERRWRKEGGGGSKSSVELKRESEVTVSCSEVVHLLLESAASFLC